jgi:hypothetical protein
LKILSNSFSTEGKLSSEKPEYKRASGVTALVIFVFLLVFTATGFVTGGPIGAVTGFFGFLLMLTIPVFSWNLLLRGSAYLLDAVVIRRKFEGILRRIRIAVPKPSNCFRVERSFQKSSTWRFFQIVSIVVVVSSYLTLLLRLLSVLNPQDEPLVFFFIGYAALAFGVPLVVGVLWVYEDAGVRWIDRLSGTISRLGTPIEQFLVGFGFVSAFARFVYSLKSDPATAWGEGIAILLLLIPICAFVAIYFHTEYYAGVIERFLGSKVARQLPAKEIRLEDRVD